MSENSETQTDWEVEDKIRFLLENLIVDIGVQVTDDYKDKNGLYEGMSIKNVRSRNKYIKLFVELLADARREERAYIIDLIQDEHNFTWVGVEGMCLIKDIVATLREEEKHG